MLKKEDIIEKFNRVFYFFPFQLLLLHLKKNHLVIAFWIFLFGITNGAIFKKFGLSFLILAPEYLGEINVYSFGILGFSLGGFIMAFNLYSYIMHGFRFTFITTVSKPLFKFTINNFIIPLIFVINYTVLSYYYQTRQELFEPSIAWQNLGAFYLGNLLFIGFSIFYFLNTNLDILKLFKADNKKLKVAKQTQKRWSNLKMNRRTWRVETYLAHPFKIQLARDTGHYSNDVIIRILQQNHTNASFFEIIMVVSFVVIGSLTDYKLFIIPAGASILLLCTIALMLISALYSWFKGWTLSIILGIAILFNYVLFQENITGAESRAYGMSYNKKVDIDAYRKANLPKAETIIRDKAITIEMMQKRIKHIQDKYGIKKPKLIFINTSGGGLRSALWSYNCLTYLDSISDGQFFDHTQLITGSSGGMIGTSLFRDLFIDGEKNYVEYFHHLGKDILNPIAVSLVTNDLFLRYKTIEDNNITYTKDRGTYFEKQLKENVNGYLDKRIGDYKILEQEAKIPQLIISPTLVNDARKLLICSNGVSFLTVKEKDKRNKDAIYENYDFQDMFKRNMADSLRLSTALRMSASFPYILPSTFLPTKEATLAIDAGLRDNYGLTTTTDYIWTFRKWLRRNCSGIIIVQLRDLDKEAAEMKGLDRNFITKITSPVNSLYSNIFNIHNYQQDQLFKILNEALEIPVSLYTVQLHQDLSNRVSLSLHLSSKEKNFVRKGIETKKNQELLHNIVEEIQN